MAVNLGKVFAKRRESERTDYLEQAIIAFLNTEEVLDEVQRIPKECNCLRITMASHYADELDDKDEDGDYVPLEERLRSVQCHPYDEASRNSAIFVHTVDQEAARMIACNLLLFRKSSNAAPVKADSAMLERVAKKFGLHSLCFVFNENPYYDNVREMYYREYRLTLVFKDKDEDETIDQ